MPQAENDAPLQTAEGRSRTEPPQREPSRPPAFGDGIPPQAQASLWFYLALFGGIFLLNSTLFSGFDAHELAYSEFRERVETDRVERVVITADRIHGRFRAEGEESEDEDGASHEAATPMEVPTKRTPWNAADLWKRIRSLPETVRQGREAAREESARHFTVVPLDDPELLPLLEAHRVEYQGHIESHWLRGLFLNWILPFGLIFLLWGFFMRRMGKGGGPNVLSMGRTKAKIYEVDEANKVSFEDLAGIDEAIEDTREVVAYLKQPDQFRRLGAKLPKGALLTGPPGTGKTLLARAIAGESGVPFFSLSGSDFVEMFVGVGAARVRDLFAEAKKRAPCIIFIDELDAIGKARGGNAALVTGGYDERENTLNQLLVEMDGFDASAGVVILAATNRPEVLDPALLRAGRFDRRIVLDRPSRAGRSAIFRIHTRNLPVADDVDHESLAAQTPGMVGSDIANVCNEAALLASRSDATQIAMGHFQEAIERTIAGPEKKSRVVGPQEREIIAFHESGHAMVGYLTPNSDPVQKISIIPRAAGALGYTLQMPLEDRFLMRESELRDRIRVLLAGRAAEAVVFGEVSTGASDDLQKASAIARDMLAVYGMSEAATNVSLVAQPTPGYLGQAASERSHSEALAAALDEEVAKLVGHCFEEAKQLLGKERALLDRLAGELLEQEELDQGEVEALLGPKPAAAPWSADAS